MSLLARRCDTTTSTRNRSLNSRVVSTDSLSVSTLDRTPSVNSSTALCGWVAWKVGK